MMNTSYTWPDVFINGYEPNFRTYEQLAMVKKKKSRIYLSILFYLVTAIKPYCQSLVTHASKAFYLNADKVELNK